MKCNKCGCLVNEYYHSYKYDDLDYCHHCVLETLVDLGVIKITSYNEEYKRFLESYRIEETLIHRTNEDNEEGENEV